MLRYPDGLPVERAALVFLRRKQLVQVGMNTIAAVGRLSVSSAWIQLTVAPTHVVDVPSMGSTTGGGVSGSLRCSSARNKLPGSS